MRLLILCLILPFPVFAGVGVQSPYVNAGVQLFDTDGFYTFNDGENRLRTRLTYDVGVNEHLLLRLRTSAQDNGQDRFHYDNTEIGARIAFAAPGALPIDLGLYTGLIVDEEDEDQTLLSLRFLAGKRIGNWQHHGEILITPSFQKQLSDADLELRLRTQYRFNPQWAVGGEWFSEMGSISDYQPFGQTNQRAGPFVGYRTSDRRYYAEFTALSGLNADTDDALIKWRIGTRF